MNIAQFQTALLSELANGKRIDNNKSRIFQFYFSLHGMGRKTRALSRIFFMASEKSIQTAPKNNLVPFANETFFTSC